MMCRFESVGAGLYRCMNCNTVWPPPGASEWANKQPIERVRQHCVKPGPEPERIRRPVGLVEYASHLEPCIHRGPVIDTTRECNLCGGDKGKPFEVLACAVHGECSLTRKHSKVKSCLACTDFKPIEAIPEVSEPFKAVKENTRGRKLIWSYGVTTVKMRLDNGILERTLKSLADGGFDKPHLFIDGANDIEGFAKFGLDYTLRYPAARIAGNWMLSLYELYIRTPNADRFALFQDDFVTYRNLRQYLEKSPYPENGYCNLYTFPINQTLAPKAKTGWFQSNQMGKGAVALVFNNLAVTTLLGRDYLIQRFKNSQRGHRAIDGGIIDSWRGMYKEYCHHPSLVQHTGLMSTHGGPQPQASSFMGEGFDALSLLQESVIAQSKD